MPPKKKTRPNESWKEVVKEAQRILSSSQQWVWDATNQDDGLAGDSRTQEDITAMPFRYLLGATRNGEVSASSVVAAFLSRAVVAQDQTKCITEFLGPRAAARANSLDALSPENRGALHGIPLSVKSHVSIKGSHTPAGYIAYWSNIPTADALLVRILEQAGAVAHVRTTEPQSMMQLECVSNLYGTTLNPYNPDLSPGGSSGGEAAVLALGGSALGIGSDVAGSIRVPAAACGIYGLKPTGFRVPTRGWSSTPPGADPIPTVLGPMCPSLEGVETFMKVVLDARPWEEEPALVPIPWRRVDIRPSREKPLRIGVARHDGLVLPHPPITNALSLLVEKMKGVGIEVVEFPFYKLDEAWVIMSSLCFADGGEADVKAMAASGEPMMPLVKWILKENPAVKKLSRGELEYWLEEREEYRIEFNDEWNKTGTWDEEGERWVGVMDALVCPVGPGVATRHNTAKYFAYSAVWNLLDFPALAFPVGRVGGGRDGKGGREESEFMSEYDRENWALYDEDVFDGMPIGLQIVGRRFDDEKIVEVLKYLKSKGCVEGR